MLSISYNDDNWLMLPPLLFLFPATFCPLLHLFSLINGIQSQCETVGESGLAWLTKLASLKEFNNRSARDHVSYFQSPASAKAGRSHWCNSSLLGLNIYLPSSQSVTFYDKLRPIHYRVELLLLAIFFFFKEQPLTTWPWVLLKIPAMPYRVQSNNQSQSAILV